MKKKKILILALLGDPTLPAGVSHTGGYNQTLRELLIALAAFQIPICVITDTSQYSTKEYEKISDNIDLYRIPIKKSEHENQEELRVAKKRVLSDIINVLNRTVADVVLIHSFYWFSGYLAKCLNEIYRIPYIHTPISLAYNKIVAGCEANCPLQVECEPSFLQNASWVLAITEQEANILTSYYKVEPSRIIVTGRSVDEVFHNPARDNRGYPRGINHAQVPYYYGKDAPWWNAGAFIYLGRMVPIKGVLQIIQSWCALRKHYGSVTPPLWLVGGSPTQIANLREDVMKYIDNIDEYEKQQGIVWWGCLDQASISALFLKALVLVTHSKFEAGGRVILEAMCQGKPVIATPTGFAADYIRDGVNGFLVTYGNTKRLAQCMEYFIRQPYLSCSMGNAARLTFEQVELSWNYIGIHQKIYKCYLQGEIVQLCDSSSSLPIFTYETLEKVDCFPYFDMCFTETEWLNELSLLFLQPPEAFSKVTQADLHSRQYRCRNRGMLFRVKQFYNRLNENAIWNLHERKKVLGSVEQLYLADVSQQFSGVVSILFSSSQGSYYVLPELEPMNLNYNELCELLYAFSTSKPPELSMLSACDNNWVQKDMLCTDSCPKTLEAAIEHLVFSSKELGSDITSKILFSLPDINKLLKDSLSDARFGFNYGKSPSHHVVTQNGHPMLLPTANWYWGELGPDFVDVALQNGTAIRAIPGQKDNTRQHLWLVYLAWKKVLQAEWSGATPESFWMQLLIQTMSDLGLVNDFIKF